MMAEKATRHKLDSGIYQCRGTVVYKNKIISISQVANDKKTLTISRLDIN
jgi:hypothetical protein